MNKDEPWWARPASCRIENMHCVNTRRHCSITSAAFQLCCPLLKSKHYGVMITFINSVNMQVTYLYKLRASELLAFSRQLRHCHQLACTFHVHDMMKQRYSQQLHVLPQCHPLADTLLNTFQHMPCMTTCYPEEQQQILFFLWTFCRSSCS